MLNQYQEIKWKIMQLGRQTRISATPKESEWYLDGRQFTPIEVFNSANWWWLIYQKEPFSRIWWVSENTFNSEICYRKMAKKKINGIVMQNEGVKQREFFFSREWSPMAKCPHTSTAHPFVRRQKPSNYSPEPAVKLSNRTFSLGNLYHVITVSPVSVYQSTISRFF